MNIQYKPVPIHFSLYGFLPQHLSACYNKSLATGMEFKVQNMLVGYQDVWNPRRSSTTRKRRSVMEWLGLGGAANLAYNSYQIWEFSDEIDRIRNQVVCGTGTVAELVNQLAQQDKVILNSVHLTGEAVLHLAQAVDKENEKLFNQTKCLTASLIMLQRLKDLLGDTDRGCLNDHLFTNHTLTKILGYDKQPCNDRDNSTDGSQCKLLQCKATGTTNNTILCTGHAASRSFHTSVLQS
nr:PREDICTED: uncharacterized protein LOC106701962 [Latimeria chalumnae]|eukprot:XP_014339494.1 PREDICTED: uncharacterized protein LOC106701962 [Latimeria chalumnae]